jgi:L-ribulose-5-phosphate 3-epimerase
MNTPAIGILQGRLTPTRGRGIQFFPAEPGEWKREFHVAKELGISHIQWVFDSVQNPLLDAKVWQEVRELCLHEVRVHNTDIQLLVQTDVVDVEESLVRSLCMAINDIQGGAIELPFMEHSTLLDEEGRAVRLAALQRWVAHGRDYGVEVALESDLPPEEYAQIITSAPNLSVVYDTGNSAGMGYDMKAEFAAYGPRISNVHIKDKKKGGTTVPLGMGSVDFELLFQLLRDLSYTGEITLQAARGEDGKEQETVAAQMKFIQDLYAKYF